MLEQVQPATLPPPAPPGTGLVIDSGPGVTLPNTEPFLVQSIRIAGNTLFDTPTLHALVAEAEGQSLTLLQLQERVARLTRYYRDRGYPLSRAIIPQQTIDSGSVLIEIIEARYDLCEDLAVQTSETCQVLQFRDDLSEAEMRARYGHGTTVHAFRPRASSPI